MNQRPSIGAMAIAAVRLLRIRHWLKNTFVLAPLLFAGDLGQTGSVIAALVAFGSFCLMSSAVYAVNDLLDRDSDRHHPEKEERPIAAGLVPVPVALTAGLALAGASLCLAATMAPAVLALLSGYFLLNLAYSAYLKRLVILDVFSIAAGFVIRVLVGAYAISVAASHWLLLCTFLLALFLGFSKRRTELVLLQNGSESHRPVLAWYSAELITYMNLIVCAATIVCYALYTVAPETVQRFHTDALVYSVPFVVYGVFRYLFLVHTLGKGGNPADVVLRDRPLLACVTLWAAYCSFVIYAWRG